MRYFPPLLLVRFTSCARQQACFSFKDVARIVETLGPVPPSSSRITVVGGEFPCLQFVDVVSSPIVESRRSSLFQRVETLSPFASDPAEQSRLNEHGRRGLNARFPFSTPLCRLGQRSSKEDTLEEVEVDAGGGEVLDHVP